ncbi:MAG: HD domain-containing protein [Synergistaceae bacterium]|nr:HD domain-containing protein [Synergistaceae bacterium]MBR0203147.1 HD domain-containing protein [Synergistaceae bacterium]
MSKKLLTIKEVKLLPVDAEFYVKGVASRLTRRVDRNNNPFWEMALSDQTGDIEGKIWGTSSWINRQGGDSFPVDPDNCGLRFEGSSIGISGKVGQFRDLLQYNFNEVYYLDQEQNPPSGFVKKSPVDSAYLEDSFRDLIAEVSHKAIHDFLLSVFFTKYNLWEKFKIWPAATLLHHAYVGGLLEHSVSVAIGARDIARHYESFKVPVNMNIVLAGALLHDIGKLESYTVNTTPKNTVKGNTLDHIILGSHMFMKFAEAEDLNEDISHALAHIIVSHHGLREFGSPVLPQTPEAMIVSAADDLDFKLNYWKTQIEALSPQSEFTDFLSFIDRRLWRGVEIK